MTHPAPGPARVRLCEGMIPYMLEWPPWGVLLRFHNEYSGESWTGYANEICPEANAVCLWWGWTALGRMQATPSPSAPSRPSRGTTP